MNGDQDRIALLGGRFDPVTQQFGMIKAPASDCAGWLLDRMKSHQGWKRNYSSARMEKVFKGIEELLSSLDPLDACKKAFVPCKNGWTAYFENWTTGLRNSVVIDDLSTELDVPSVYINNVPHTYKTTRIDGKRYQSGRLGSIAMWYNDPAGPPLHSYTRNNLRRTIQVISEGSAWIEDNQGVPFEFEDLEAYKARRKRDRFTAEMLDRYLKEFGVSAFDESFYLSGSATPALLIHAHFMYDAGTKTFAEMHAKWAED